MKFVKLSDVEKLIDLIKERDMYQDWSDKWAECDKTINEYIFYIKRSAKEMGVEETALTKENVYNYLIADDKNIVTIGKAVRVDFEGACGAYRIFYKLSESGALETVANDIVREYKDKLDIWKSIQSELIK